ncbi:MAG: amidohydrolase family protein [Bacteroidia bacterium]|nr:amidohydrolase family protein [Bacteroidia bacterium]
MIDVKSEKAIKNAVVIIYKNKIVEINYSNQVPDSAEIVDLQGYTILPGLIDCHTHIMASGVDYDKDLYSNSSVYRAIRATSYLKASLLNGFTTIRDVGSEGTGFSDVDLSRCINEGLIDGPRFIPSADGLAVRGFYYPFADGQNWEIQLPCGTQYVSGKDECIEAVRHQISKGARWIKVYLDWRTPTGTKVIFTPEELSSIVETANMLGAQVAAHATTKEAIEFSINSGVRSIEHGSGFSDELVETALSRSVYWCPTLSVMEYFKMTGILKYEYSNLRNCYKKGLKIVLGTDAGSFPWSVNQAKELEYYTKNAGFTPIDAIKTGTINAAEMLNMDKETGQIQPGYFADIIAVKGNPMDDVTLLQNVVFVMKNGVIYKRPDK